MTFGWEGVERFFASPELWDLLVEQHRELAWFPEVNRLAPDVARMKAAEAAGIFRIWTMREDGLLVGYIEFWITPHTHYRHSLWAMDGGSYLSPRFRGNGFAYIRLWRTAIAALRQLNPRPSMLRAHENLHRPMAVVFRRLGMTTVATEFAMVL